MEGAVLTVFYQKLHQNNGFKFESVGVGVGPVLLWQYSQYACLDSVYSIRTFNFVRKIVSLKCILIF